ncbi:hypothetical protein GCM10011367_19970 [Marinicauda pacifica]|jgi:hypothetical protein|uniref:Uncharacterized protein n=2 Tax=Marinicauda pacifica TaxID=1133559 RepID=A0A4S2H856_9PROT|nr:MULTISPECIES: hypothetical protein [Marinicauda]TGY92010.1 hypothetical protein E5162_10075 [Marinicauda pacifica]GGE45198.1 hypothetical protein GCM10011367_19970 [Marinicauda pacifica]
MMKIALLIVVLMSILIASVWFAIQSFTQIDATMSVHGWIALILGVILSLLIGGGLMALVFFSSRRGYDDMDNDV